MDNVINISGKYNKAKVFAKFIETEAISQIMNMCDIKEFEGNKIRIMPDVHAGKGCTIGTTMTIKDKIIPDMVGTDIGCGVLWGKIENKERVDLDLLDSIIKKYIPTGTNIHSTVESGLFDFEKLRCSNYLERKDRMYKSIGSLGSGNHFIEIDKSDKTGDLYLVIHTGSRNLGNQVNKYYMKTGVAELSFKNSREINDIIETCKRGGLEKQINDKVLECLDKQTLSKYGVIESVLFDDYIHDMKLVQEFARINRERIMDIICKEIGVEIIDRIHTVHNYVDTESMIMRKGAVSAKRGERILIPMNMRDGSLICEGRGNPDWNYSAPHGAGRLFSRKMAKEIFTMDTFKASMDGIYSSTLSKNTLDECPMAYKPYKSIVKELSDTVNVLEIIKPIYNYKGA